MDAAEGVGAGAAHACGRGERLPEHHGRDARAHVTAGLQEPLPRGRVLELLPLDVEGRRAVRALREPHDGLRAEVFEVAEESIGARVLALLHRHLRAEGRQAVLLAPACPVAVEPPDDQREDADRTDGAAHPRARLFDVREEAPLRVVGRDVFLALLRRDDHAPALPVPPHEGRVPRLEPHVPQARPRVEAPHALAHREAHEARPLEDLPGRAAGERVRPAAAPVAREGGRARGVGRVRGHGHVERQAHHGATQGVEHARHRVGLPEVVREERGRAEFPRGVRLQRGEHVLRVPHGERRDLAHRAGAVRHATRRAVCRRGDGRRAKQAERGACDTRCGALKVVAEAHRRVLRWGRGRSV